MNVSARSPTREAASAAAYLDYNATAPIKPAVAEAVAEALAFGGNASSVHRYGRRAREALDLARDRVAAMVAAEPEAVVFTSGGTEANALGLRSLVARRVTRLLISATEHDSVLAAAHRADLKVLELPVGPDGILDLDALDDALAASGAAGVAVHLANNETGVCQPIPEIARRVHAAGGWLHCDAVQGPGRVAVNVRELGADTVALSGHKIGGPQGAGAVVAADPGKLSPFQVGGGQERGIRAGTENVPGIAGFGMAASLAAEDLAAGDRIMRLRDALEHRLKAAAPDALIFGSSGGRRLPNTTCVALPGVSSDSQVIALDLAGVAVSAGAACSSGKVRPSHVLLRMGVGEALAGSAIRVSLGWATTADELDRFATAWLELADRRAAAAAPAADRAVAGRTPGPRAA